MRDRQAEHRVKQREGQAGKQAKLPVHQAEFRADLLLQDDQHLAVFTEGTTPESEEYLIDASSMCPLGAIIVTDEDGDQSEQIIKKLSGVMLVVPVANMVLLTKELLLGATSGRIVGGNVTWTALAWVLASTTLYAAAAVAVATKIFGTESVVFSIGAHNDLIGPVNQRA